MIFNNLQNDYQTVRLRAEKVDYREAIALI